MNVYVSHGASYIANIILKFWIILCECMLNPLIHRRGSNVPPFLLGLYNQLCWKCVRATTRTVGTVSSHGSSRLSLGLLRFGPYYGVHTGTKTVITDFNGHINMINKTYNPRKKKLAHFDCLRLKLPRSPSPKSMLIRPMSSAAGQRVPKGWI